MITYVFNHFRFGYFCCKALSLDGARIKIAKHIQNTWNVEINVHELELLCKAITVI